MKIPGSTRIARALAMSIVMVLACCGLAAAQQAGPDPSFERMRTKLKAGDRLTVDLMNGSAVEGRVIDAGPDTMSISTDTGDRLLSRRDVAIVRRHGHGILLGSVIGAGVGLTCGVFVGMILAGEGYDDRDPAVFGLTLVGLGVGAGIDALVNFPKTIYQQSSPSRTTVKVEAGPRRTAVRVAVRF